MQVVALDNCKEGMEVAKPIINKFGLTLVEKDVRLTLKLIELLKRRNVKVVYIKDEPTNDAVVKVRENFLKKLILFLISFFLIVLMCFKSIQTSTHLIPAEYSDVYLLLSRFIYIIVILQQIFIVWLKQNEFGSTVFHQIISFVFSFNILTLAVIFFQNTALKAPDWKLFYSLIFLEIFLFIISIAAWKGVSNAILK